MERQPLARRQKAGRGRGRPGGPKQDVEGCRGPLGGHPRFPPALPHYGITALFAADDATPPNGGALIPTYRQTARRDV
jgi:hypothetical protein